MTYTLRFDGCSKGNPGPSSCSFVIYYNDIIVVEGYKALGHTTNNVAEYSGLVEGLKLRLSPIRIEGDSMLVISQTNGTWKVNSVMKPYHDEVKTLLTDIEYTAKHIPRINNKDADRVANLAL